MVTWEQRFEEIAHEVNGYPTVYEARMKGIVEVLAQQIMDIGQTMEVAPDTILMSQVMYEVIFGGEYEIE